METDELVIFSDTSPTDLKPIHTALSNSGYRVGVVALKHTQGFGGVSESARKIALLGSEPATKYLDCACEQFGPFNLIMGFPERFKNLRELEKYTVDFSLLPMNTEEVNLRLRRSACILDTHEHSPACLLEMNMVGSSPLFREFLHLLSRYARVDAPVLISGETGTGKDLAARAIHYSSPRKANAYQALNCGTLPDHLVENELFGHTRGAYTDASSSREGIVAMASGGTLFLDEVDSLSMRAQTALLRFLQDGIFRQLGGEERSADVRIIAASNRSLAALADAGLFRNDLLYRLNTLTLELPALRDRREDILPLACHFLGKCSREYARGHKYLNVAVEGYLLNNPWPGNIRELENFITRAYLLTDQALIHCCPEQAQHSAPADDREADVAPSVEFAAAKQHAINMFEAQYVTSLLRETGGNVSRAAKLAGKERRCFGKLMKKHGIDRAAFDSPH